MARHTVWLLWIVAGSMIGETPEKERQEMTDSNELDRKAILAHIDGLFGAYVRRDRDAIRRGHTADWTGFQGPSTKIERGIEDYMVNAERSLEALTGTGYEIHDSKVELHGDLAIVYYIATYRYRDQEGHEGAIPLRSIDIYRREPEGWNQAGSHITVIPSSASWGEDEHAPKSAPRSTERSSTLSDQDKKALLTAREAVWRAWFGNDVETMKQLLPADLVAIDADTEEWAGLERILQRAEAFHRKGGKLTRLEFPETRIQMIDGAAVLYTKYVIETEVNGERSTLSGRGTEMFAHRNGHWVNTGWHLDAGEQLQQQP